MPGITNLYSKTADSKHKAVEYGPFSKGLKIQLVYIFKDCLNDVTHQGQQTANHPIWGEIDGVLRREHMLTILYSDPFRELAAWYMVCQYFELLRDTEKELDVIQTICLALDKYKDYNYFMFSKYKPEQALADINTRLQEHGVGFRYQTEQIVRIPAELTYKEAIEPALILLTQKGFENAERELFNAFKHYKKGAEEYEESLVNCLKAIESTIKIIANARRWSFDPKDTAKDLIKIILDNGLVPNYSVNFLSGIRNTLESGVPPLRNKMGGHGKGIEARIVDEPSMHYCINLTAAVILYLVQRHQEMPL